MACDSAPSGCEEHACPALVPVSSAHQPQRGEEPRAGLGLDLEKNLLALEPAACEVLGPEDIVSNQTTPIEQSSSSVTSVSSGRLSPGAEPACAPARVSFTHEELLKLRHSPLAQELPSVPSIPGVTAPGSARPSRPKTSHRGRRDHKGGGRQAKLVPVHPILRWGRFRVGDDQSANIFRFLWHASPMLPGVSGCAQTRRLVPLARVWEFFDAPYGHEMGISVHGAPACAVYVPHLSALRVRTNDGRLVCEFFERKTPDQRLPLYEQVEELSQRCPMLLSGCLGDLDVAASWFCISWYPILCYKSLANMLSGMFLTYHSFELVDHPYLHLLEPDDDNDDDNDSNTKGEGEGEGDAGDQQRARNGAQSGNGGSGELGLRREAAQAVDAQEQAEGQSGAQPEGGSRSQLKPRSQLEHEHENEPRQDRRREQAQRAPQEHFHGQDDDELLRSIEEWFQGAQFVKLIGFVPYRVHAPTWYSNAHMQANPYDLASTPVLDIPAALVRSVVQFVGTEWPELNQRDHESKGEGEGEGERPKAEDDDEQCHAAHAHRHPDLAHIQRHTLRPVVLHDLVC